MPSSTPTRGAPSTEVFTAAEIPPADFLLPPQIIFPVAGSHANCITIIDWADEPEDYTVPEDRSFMFAYVIHRLLLPATLSLKLEFWNAHGPHIEPATNSICLLSGSSGIFYRWSIVYLLNWSYNLPGIISFGSIHSFATISLDFCMHPLGLTKSNYFYYYACQILYTIVLNM